jgi:hypothetical protein
MSVLTDRGHRPGALKSIVRVMTGRGGKRLPKLAAKIARSMGSRFRRSAGPPGRTDAGRSPATPSRLAGRPRAVDRYKSSGG